MVSLSCSSRPAQRENCSRIRAKRGVSASLTSETVAMAPALIMALAGRPVSRASEISLNASPLGSTSIFASTASSPWSSSASP